MGTVLIIIGIVVLVAIAVWLFTRVGGRKRVERLENVSDERRRAAQQHNVRASQLEQELERERTQAERHAEQARAAEQKLASKR